MVSVINDFLKDGMVVFAILFFLSVMTRFYFLNRADHYIEAWFANNIWWRLSGIFLYLGVAAFIYFIFLLAIGIGWSQIGLGPEMNPLVEAIVVNGAGMIILTLTIIFLILEHLSAKKRLRESRNAHIEY